MPIDGDASVTVTRIIGVDGAVTTVRCRQRENGALGAISIRTEDRSGVLRFVWLGRLHVKPTDHDVRRVVSSVLAALSPYHKGTGSVATSGRASEVTTSPPDCDGWCTHPITASHPLPFT